MLLIEETVDIANLEKIGTVLGQSFWFQQFLTRLLLVDGIRMLKYFVYTKAYQAEL